MSQGQGEHRARADDPPGTPQGSPPLPPHTRVDTKPLDQRSGGQGKLCLALASPLRASDPAFVSQARLLSKVPSHLVNGFTNFNRHTHPNERDRSRFWETALKELVAWWAGRFHVLRKGHLVRQLATDVQAQLDEVAAAEKAGKLKQAKRLRDKMEKDAEVIHSTRSLSKHVRAMEGSRDMSAQLFTCLCRALGLGARLVFSLQPMDWRAPSAAGGAKAKPKAAKATNGKSPAKGRPSAVAQGKANADTTDSGGDSGWRDGRGELNYKVPAIKLRRGRPTQSKRAASPGKSRSRGGVSVAQGRRADRLSLSSQTLLTSHR